MRNGGCCSRPERTERCASGATAGALSSATCAWGRCGLCASSCIRIAPLIGAVASTTMGDDLLEVWDWQRERRLYRHRLDEAPLHLGFTSRGSSLVYSLAQFDSVVFLDAATGERQLRLPTGFGIVSYVATSTNERTIMTYQPTGEVRYWDAASGAAKGAVSTLPGLEVITLSADKNLLVAPLRRRRGGCRRRYRGVAGPARSLPPGQGGGVRSVCPVQRAAAGRSRRSCLRAAAACTRPRDDSAVRASTPPRQRCHGGRVRAPHPVLRPRRYDLGSASGRRRAIRAGRVAGTGGAGIGRRHAAGPRPGAASPLRGCSDRRRRRYPDSHRARQPSRCRCRQPRNCCATRSGPRWG